jgi:hypothetical protein
MPESRTDYLGQELVDCVPDVVERFHEYLEALEHSGQGVHRDPGRILDELGNELLDLRCAARGLGDEIERASRGMRP